MIKMEEPRKIVDQSLIAIAKERMCIFKFKQQSKVSYIAVVRLIQNGIFENLIYLLLSFMQSKWTISPHEIINIDHPPLSESILPQPLNKSLQFVPGLEVRRSLHLVLKHHQMLIGIQLLRNRELRHRQSKRGFDEHEDAEEHLLISLIDGLVCLGVGESLVIVGEVERSVGDQPELFILRVSVILGRVLILTSHDRESSHHHGVNYLATLLHFFCEFLLLCNFDLIFLLFCHLKGLQDALLEPQLPILIHVLGITVHDRIEASFVDLEQEVSDSGRMDSVVAHHPLGEVAVRLVESLAIDPAESERNLYLLGKLYPHQFMLLPQLLHPTLELLARLLLLNHPLH